MIYFLIFLALFALPALAVISIYNKLQRNKLKTEESWSSIGALLQQRYDLIPSLVETVKGYARHEQTTLTELTSLRGVSMSAKGASGHSDTEPRLVQALSHVFALAENYPDLKADSQFTQLQTQLTMIENSISGARQQYNAAVRSFNTTIAVFPNNMVASFFNITPVDFFQEKQQASEPVSVRF